MAYESILGHVEEYHWHFNMYRGTLRTSGFSRRTRVFGGVQVAFVYTPFLCAMCAKQNRCRSNRGPAALFVAPLVEFIVPHLKG